ncbi:HNH endonuclease [Salinibacter ruber]|uniref:HNH endonuclease n=1 Tax=Salinibacter ruber TaxID=146919 RepID=UPI0021692B4F|nr:HNH endonuclease [Salinibacter ruber]MCS3822660.1 putative restriction endonuclease [Salinibacter ruber]
MDIEKFDRRDEPFFKWMGSHPSGYVLNTKRNPETTYAVFHRSGCRHLLSRAAGRPPSDESTEHIKICAEETEPLVEWILENRSKAVAEWMRETQPSEQRNARTCGTCKSYFGLEGLFSNRSLEEETQPEGFGEDSEAETTRAAQPTTIQIEDFISRVKELEGETLLTKTGSEYSVHLNEGEVVFTLLPEKSSEDGRPLPKRELSKVLKRFNETYSLSTGDYKELTVNASYILPILNQIRQEEGDYTPRRAKDLDEPEQPNRVRREVLRVVRDSTHSRTVKEEQDYECQICGETLRLANGDRYAEAHHVHPLGEGGKDIPANIMCVCPNHHALLDYGAIPLDLEEIEGVGSEYIEYHNSQIFESEQGD